MAAGSSTDPVRFPTDMLTVPSALAALLVIVIGTAPLPFPAAAQVHQRAPVPGEVDPRVIQATIQSTICTPGHTAKVRPPRKVTDAIKRKPAQELPGSPSDYELDHLIPIGLGGHPPLDPEPLAPGLDGGGGQGSRRAPAAPRRVFGSHDARRGPARGVGDLGPSAVTA